MSFLKHFLRARSSERGGGTGIAGGGGGGKEIKMGPGHRGGGHEREQGGWRGAREKKKKVGRGTRLAHPRFALSLFPPPHTIARTRHAAAGLDFLKKILKNKEKSLILGLGP